MAFRDPKFSADVASLADAANPPQVFPDGWGFAEFLCGNAMALGYSAHLEPEHGNDAHANVYFDGSAGRRKTAARALASKVSRLVLPETPNS